MKHWLLFISLIYFGSPANAEWQGKLNLDPIVSPIMIRELHDGQWLGGVTKENIWHLDQDGVQRIHAGVFQAWNAEHGNASFGMVAGIDLPVDAGAALGVIADGIGLSNTIKPLSYASSALSLDFIGGYRPIHTSDVDGNWIYGFGLKLKVAFGVKELQKGT